jgi:hypothetical protein
MGKSASKKKPAAALAAGDDESARGRTLRRRRRTLSSSKPVCPCAPVKRTDAQSSSAIIKSHLCAESNRPIAAIASRLCRTTLTNFRAAIAKRRETFGF